MAILRPIKQYKHWHIRAFPRTLKSDFKVHCVENKKIMTSVLRGLARNYVNDTSQMVTSVKSRKFNKKKEDIFIWSIKSFPTKLQADFKSCCILRGETMADAMAFMIKEYLEENNGEEGS